jgi:serine/threonine protein kinase
MSRWDFRVAIIDFGFSMRFDPASDCSTWISSSELGTWPFISPEKQSAEETGLPFQVLPADVCFAVIPDFSVYSYSSKVYALGASLKQTVEWETATIGRIRELVSKVLIISMTPAYQSS